MIIDFVALRKAEQARKAAELERTLAPALSDVGTVYLIEGGEKLKIGFTGGHPKKRLSGIQVGLPYTLKIVDCFRGTRADERALHEAFQHLRVRGEWFRRSIAILDHFEAASREPTRTSPHRPPRGREAIRILAMIDDVRERTRRLKQGLQAAGVAS